MLLLLLFAGTPVGLGPAVAHAETDWALNGTFLVTSNGDWAKTNNVYRDEASMQSHWTVTMTWTLTSDCKGRVVSSAGWSADIRSSYGEWIVERELPDWEPCADGAHFVGYQRFRFYPVDEAGLVRPGSPVMAGVDETQSPSGACRLNQPLRIALPLRLDRLD